MFWTEEYWALHPLISVATGWPVLRSIALLESPDSRYGGVEVSEIVDTSSHAQFRSIFIATQVVLLAFVSCWAITSSQAPGPKQMLRTHWSRLSITYLILQISILGSAMAILTVTYDVKERIRLSASTVQTILCALGSIVASVTLYFSNTSTIRGVYHGINAALWLLRRSVIRDPPRIIVHLDELITILHALAFSCEILRPYEIESHPVIPPHGTSAFQWILFSWLAPLMEKARERSLELADLWQLDASLYMSIVERTSINLNNFSRQHGLLRHIISTNRKRYFWSALCAASDSGARLVTPWLLRLLLQRPSLQALAAMFAIRVLANIAATQATYSSRLIAGTAKVMFGNMIYAKSLRLTSRGREINMAPANLVDNDLQRMQEFLFDLNNMVIAPVQATVALISVASVLSWQSAICSAMTLLLAYPIFKYLAVKMNTIQGRMMMKKDVRIRLISEVIQKIKTIKLYGWEAPFEGKIAQARTEELSEMRLIAIVQGSLMGVMSAIPQIMASLAFFAFFVEKGRLDYDTVFPALGFFTLFNGAFSNLSQSISLWFSFSVAASRVSIYLGLDEEDKERSHQQGAVSLTQPYIRIVGASFPLYSAGIPTSWLLQNVGLDISSPKLLTISGPVGSGKTTLLTALVGGVSPASGRVEVNGSMAYYSQSPWLVAGTIRENIVFDMPFDKSWYSRVLKACALDTDLQTFPLGDETVVSFGGNGLSGGQRSRVMLARVVFSRAHISVLDDPFAALDVSTQKHIAEHLFGTTGVLKNSICIVATSAVTLKRYADVTCNITDGHLRMLVKSKDFLSYETGVVETISQLSLEETNTLSDGIQDDPDKIVNNIGLRSPTSANAVVLSNDIDIETGKALNEPAKSSGIQDERSVKLSVYISWLRYARIEGWVAVVAFIVLGRLTQISSSYTLTKLSGLEKNKSLFYLFAFTALGLSQAFCTFGFVMVTFFFCLLPAARRVHLALTNSALESSLGFFLNMAPGQLLNRFSNDISKLDGSLASTAISLMVSGSTGIMIVVVLIAQSRWSICFLLPLAIIYWKLQNLYLKVMRDIKRIELQTRSPLLNGIQEAWAGHLCINSGGHAQFFRQRYAELIVNNLRAYLPLSCLELWLQLRLNMIADLVIFFAGTVLIRTGTSPAILGFTMTFILQITIVLSTIVRVRAALEADMISVERILQIVNSQPENEEAADMAPYTRPPASWPAEGQISFQNFGASYGPNTLPCLKNITLDIQPEESVAVVGRSGAGKSSLALSITRFIEKSSGVLEIDGLDVCGMCPKELRSRVTTIPQQPEVFTGTLRFNLDPLGIHNEQELGQVIQDSGLLKSLGSSQNLLDLVIKESGTNLSEGQIQLIAVARILLANTKVLILDEATSAVDYELDELIQSAFKKKMESCTVINVAHRIENILDYDRVLVLEKGEVACFGSPKDLLRDPDSLFSILVKEANLWHRAEDMFGSL